MGRATYWGQQGYVWGLCKQKCERWWVNEGWFCAWRWLVLEADGSSEERVPGLEDSVGVGPVLGRGQIREKD